MNILYIADPTSIHDIRWINFFARERNIACFVLPRECHVKNFNKAAQGLDNRVRVLNPIKDPSTIRPIRTFRQFMHIRNVIKEFGIQILHIMYAEPNALWANGHGLFGVPIVLTTRGTDVLKTIPKFFAKKNLFALAVAFQYRTALRNIDEITCTSNSQVRALSALKIKTPMKIVRTGIDFNNIPNPDFLALNKVRKGKPFVFMPRNMKPIYNHDFTLDAIRLISHQIRKEYAFVFIKSVDDHDPYYRSICAKASSIDADIRFIPLLSHQELFMVYRQASLVVMNPKSDGSPVTAMEAMACGKPVVLPPLPYDPEVFRGVWFFEDWSPSSLVQKIETLLRMDPAELSGKLKMNYETVRAHGNLDKEMRKIEEVYESLIQ